MELINEDSSMCVISRWLKLFNVPTWWNHGNEEFPVFHTTGTGRSDLLIKYDHQYILIECKNADKDSNIYDAFFQTLNYSVDNTTYKINDIDIKIDGIVIATENSINGHLFDIVGEKLRTKADFSNGRVSAIHNGEIPAMEYSMTEELTRLLWRGISEYDIERSIGVLLSDKLNGSDLPVPLLLMKNKKHQYMQVLR